LLEPFCEAVMEHVPIVRSVTTFDETVQTVVLLEVKLIVRPEEAVAVRLTVPALNGVLFGALKEMVWEGRVTVKLCVTGAAAM
jgi:hypothetical protein